MGDVPLNGLVSPAFSHETLLPDDRRRRLALHLQRSELNQMIFDRMGDPRAGVLAHLTPTKRKKRTANGDILPFCLQGRCRVCKCLSTFMGSLCEDSLECTTTTWICHTKKGKLCFPTHLEMCHGE
jgi:hypothetical protein